MLLLACAAPVLQAPPAPDILLITIDTIRADALGSYGNAAAHTPVLDALAAGGTRVAEAGSVTPLTLPAHTSILTGIYPDRHGVRDNNGFQAAPELTTLAEILSAQGYQTAALVSAAVLDRRFGLDQGFDRYTDGFDSSAAARSARVPDRQADLQRGLAQEWLDTVAPDRPFFGWVHFYDPHLPLEAPPEWVARAGGDPYLGEIAFTDHQIGIIQEHIAVLHRNRPLLLVVSGDHGEDRGDHGEGTHGIFLYRSTMHIPLIFSGAGVPAGAVYGDPASLVDIAPTVLSLLGLPVPPEMDGQPLIQNGALQPHDRPIYAESWSPRLQFGMSELRSLQDRQHRYIRAPRSEVYGWPADPAERADLSAPDPALLAQWSAQMDAFLLNRRPISAPDDTTSALVALGYVAPLADVSADARWQDLPDPKDHPGIAVEFSLVTAAARSRPPAQGVPLIEAWLAQYPQVGAAKLLLSRGYMLLGRFDEAEAALAPLLERRPGNAQLLLQQGNIRLERGDLSGAQAIADPLRRDHPDEVEAWALSAEARRRGRDCSAAITVAEEGLRLHPGTATLRLIRAACMIARGQREEGLVEVREVLARDPGNADAREILRIGEE